MATRVVQNVLQKPSGGAATRPTTVTIRLNVRGFTDNGATEIISTDYAPVDPATGMWSWPHEVNADIDPAGTYYTVREGSGVIWTYVVEAGDTPVNLFDCLVEAPDNPSPVIAIPGPPGPQGPPGPADSFDGGNSLTVWAPLQIATYDGGHA